jgi:hypothetical protein
MDDKLYINVKHIFIYYYYIRSQQSVLILALGTRGVKMFVYFIHIHVFMYHI